VLERMVRNFRRIFIKHLFFDGSNSNLGASVGCILKYPKGKKILLACRLEFEFTNNIVE
jgi:hypothetical protein